MIGSKSRSKVSYKGGCSGRRGLDRLSPRSTFEVQKLKCSSNREYEARDATT